MSEQNAHPFFKEHFGQQLAFAHNGTVSAVKAWQINQPCTGETDSEHAFQWLLDRLPAPDSDEFPLALQSEADKIQKLGRFNVMLTDGKTIWVYADDAIFILKRRSLSSLAKFWRRNSFTEKQSYAAAPFTSARQSRVRDSTKTGLIPSMSKLSSEVNYTERGDLLYAEYENQ